ncbi:MAG: hypothetical protein HPY61_12800 [Methanotrichaceae archaeon]|nr:hypothetical protein [Methanotrichaceae archaeon]
MAIEERKIRDLPAIERIEVFNCAAAMIEQHREEFVARAAAGGWKNLSGRGWRGEAPNGERMPQIARMEHSTWSWEA